MKKKLKKYQGTLGGSQVGPPPVTMTTRNRSGVKSKTVSTSPDGNYKTVDKNSSGPRGMSSSSKTKRTISGVLSGAPKPGQPVARPIQNLTPNPPPPPPVPPKKPMAMKKGGSIKKK